MVIKPEILAVLKWLQSIGGECRNVNWIPDEYKTAFRTAVDMGLIYVTYPCGTVQLPDAGKAALGQIVGNKQPQGTKQNPRIKARLLRS